MPGAYAHLTLINEARETRRLDAVPDFPNEAKAAVLQYLKYCELGAVSPDYPYLVIGDDHAKRWADIMHYTRTGHVIQAGVKRLRQLKGETQKKCLAWLMGFAAHVTTDTTIHPVVELIVGPYQGNEMEHRICEMHQDAYIFQRMNLGPIGLAEYLDSGIAKCVDIKNPKMIDQDIVSLWTGILQEVHAKEFAANPPDINAWHKGFQFGIGKIAEEGGHLFPLARHVAMDLGLVYPPTSQIDSRYITRLTVPGGAKMDYDAIFDKAIQNVVQIWQIIANGALKSQDAYASVMGDWNLDTGRDEKNSMVFWKGGVA